MRVAVLTVSDRSASGERHDDTGPAVERLVEEGGGQVVGRALVPDDPSGIRSALLAWCDSGTADLVLTAGGTGLGPRDVTPETTAGLVQREVPGIAEAMRAAGLRTTPYAALSRQVAGQRGRTLVVNLPGSPKAATACLGAVLAVLPHAVELIRSDGR